MSHQYCLFYKNSKLQFGWIQEIRKNKLVVVPTQGKEFNCSPKQTEYIWNGADQTDVVEANEYLLKQINLVEKQRQQLDISTIHELCEINHAYSIEDLASDFLDDPENGWHRVALLLEIKNNTLLYQQKKSDFFARSPEDIEKLEEQTQKEQEKKTQKITEQNWADLLINGSTPEVSSEDSELWQKFQLRLLNFLIHWQRSEEKQYFSEMFRCNLNDQSVAERSIINCLKLTDHPISWGKLILVRASIVLEFGARELEISEKIKSGDIWKNRFKTETKDQRYLETFTVDNEETKDFDDALSWEVLGDLTLLRIHIADVASFIHKSHELFEIVSSRISSVYTIKDVYPMFVPSLSESFFSLSQGQDRSVITYEIKINSSNEIESTSIYRSIINVNQNYSYLEIDRLLNQSDSFWSHLLDFCIDLKNKRIENGCLDIDRLEVKLDISDPDHININTVRENTPASLIIEELAIYTNYLAAHYCSVNDLLCLYRNQPPYSVCKNLEEGVKPTLKDIQIQPAHIGLTADGHSALGLACYAQATSPIRRFVDLVNQNVILTHLSSQEEGFDEDELLLWAKRGEEIQREYTILERSLLEHWKIKYIAQNRDKTYSAQFIRYLKNRKALINLTELQLFIEADLPNIQATPEFEALVESVQPDYNRVILRKKE
ncbi:MAG: RNB domain-containing ribonuclease [Deltaproteobacteria bacterium]|jgi:exoribonuclease II|nr:RNB domain-containing ribonuclease [Deltaproteobacteria bacterium]MBT4525191.1 RNB domain-containing ribonuclease [Deltaproteobacteria bacterium]